LVAAKAKPHVGEIGQSLDHADLAQARQAFPPFFTARTDQPFGWHNLPIGNSGVFVSTANFRTGSRIIIALRLPAHAVPSIGAREEG